MMEEGNTAQRRFLLKAGIIVGSGGLIFGYDIGVIAGTLSKLGDVFVLSSYEEGLVVAILYVGSILGSIVGGPLCDYLGRWKTIHLQNILFIVGSFITGFATNIGMLCVGRFIVGIASAVSGIADVPYLNEISPPAYRGILSSQYEMAVSIGVLISFAVALALSGWDYGWRVAFLIPSVAAFFQSMGMFFLPESPRWLLEKGYLEKTYNVLCEIYGESFLTHCMSLPRESEKVPPEVKDFLRAYDRANRMKALTSAAQNQPIEESYQANFKENDTKKAKVATVVVIDEGKWNQADESGLQKSHGHSEHFQSAGAPNSLHGSAALRALFQKEENVLKQFSYPIYLIIVIQVLAQITGGNVIRNYAPTIFENGGVSTTLSLIFNLLFGVVKAVFTLVSILYIDRTGRLTLLVYGIVLVGVGMLFLAICSLASPSGNISNVPAFVVGCALVYAGFGLGYGPVPWVLSAEMFPTLIRGRIMSISLIASNVAQLVVNFLFLPMTEGITTSGTFFLFVALNVLTFLFAKKFLVETKEIAPEEILNSLLDRYDHSAQKLVRSWPSVYGPLVSFCCCVRRDGNIEEEEGGEEEEEEEEEDHEGGVGRNGGRKIKDESPSSRLTQGVNSLAKTPSSNTLTTNNTTPVASSVSSSNSSSYSSMNDSNPKERMRGGLSMDQQARSLSEEEKKRKARATGTSAGATMNPIVVDASSGRTESGSGSGVGTSSSKLTLLSASSAQQT